MVFKLDYKKRFLDILFDKFSGKETHILDMGSGTSASFIELLKNNKSFYYTGVEFNTESLSIARANLNGFQNVTLKTGYGEELNDRSDTYDVVISLSVLEHVKYLRQFLIKSISMCKNGGCVVHRYDLGHSLYPFSFGERLNVWLSLKAPFLISKKKAFTTHPSLKNIVDILSQNGLKNIEIDYSQSFASKKLINKLRAYKPGDNEIAKKILDFENELKDYFLPLLNDKEKELIFPTITIKGIKT